jgi:hypothetical protein
LIALAGELVDASLGFWVEARLDEVAGHVRGENPANGIKKAIENWCAERSHVIDHT